MSIKKSKFKSRESIRDVFRKKRYYVGIFPILGGGLTQTHLFMFVYQVFFCMPKSSWGAKKHILLFKKKLFWDIFRKKMVFNKKLVISLSSVRHQRKREKEMLSGCMEVHCLQCKNCQYRYIWQYPSEMSDFFPDLYLPDWMTTNPYPDHSTGPKPIQLYPGGFYYWIYRCL